MHSILSMLMVWIIMGIICALVAKSKERNIYLWFAIGALFSILGLLTLLLMPKGKKGPKAAPSKLAPVQSMNSESALPAEEENFHSHTEPVKRIQGDPALQWYYIYEKEDTIEIRGPMNIDALRVAVAKFGLQLNTYIWCEEFADWTKIADFQNSSYIMDKELIIGKGEEEIYADDGTSLPPKKEAKEKVNHDSSNEQVPPEGKNTANLQGDPPPTPEKADPPPPPEDNTVSFQAEPPLPTEDNIVPPPSHRPPTGGLPPRSDNTE